MPVPNTRIVVLGTPKANKEFEVMTADRESVARALEDIKKKAEIEGQQVIREMRRIAEELRRSG